MIVSKSFALPRLLLRPLRTWATGRTPNPPQAEPRPRWSWTQSWERLLSVGVELGATRPF